MSLYEWLLFLHVLAAFLLVAGVVVYGVLLLGPAGEPVSRALGPPALALWNVGGLGVLVFGVWLALEVDGYELWDGWIIAALILWFVASAAGGRLGAGGPRGPADPGDRPRGRHARRDVARDRGAAPRHDLQAGGVMVATIRPDAWNLPLLVHVAGAMLMVGALVVVVAAMGGALRRGDGAEALTRLAYRTLLIGVLPAFILMRVGAEWIAAEEDVPDDAGWIGMGYGISDGGLLLTIIASVVAWRATKRGADGPGGVGRAVFVLGAVLLLAYAFAIWGMTAKPD